MRKSLVTLILFLFWTLTFAQVDLGIKGGMAFGYDGTLKQTITNIKESKAKNNIGWHIGFYSRIHLLSWYLQPELYFSSMKNNFESSTEGSFTTHSNRLDIPVLVGKKILSIGRIYAGPLFSTSINEGISLKRISKTKSDDFSLGGQIGVGADISKLTLDARYEFGFNKSNTNFVNKVTHQEFTIEKKQNSLLLSVGYKF